MNRKKRQKKGEYGWIVKLIFAVTALALTVKFAVPLSSFIMSSFQPSLATGLLSFSQEGGKNTVLQSENSTAFSDVIQNSEAPETEEETTVTAEEILTEEAAEYETPEDIKVFEQEYLAAFNSVSPEGKVAEVFFRTSGATDSVGNVHIKNATSTKQPDFEALLNSGPVLSVEDISQPVVLIFHTHTTESYLLSDNGVFYEDFETRSTDKSKNMIRVGDEICKVLEANGIGYIHDENIYDESYEGAYSRSRVTVEKYLAEYPSIKIVLDVHRDAIYYSDTSHCKPTAEIDGRKAAQIMIITGAQEGYVTDFPNWEDNLRFALCFQKTAEEKYPGLMKPIYFCQRKYNMDTASCSLLLEMGTDANTLEEAVYSGYLTGNILSDIIKEYSEG